MRKACFPERGRRHTLTDGSGETAEEIRKIQKLIATDDLATLRLYYRPLLVAREK
jgi:hypothetical protein